jgi:hypothetical protein
MTTPDNNGHGNGQATDSESIDLDARLAALLDDEWTAAETGRTGQVTTAEVLDGGDRAEPTPLTPYHRQLPATRRFGAIFVETNEAGVRQLGMLPHDRALPPGPGVETELLESLPAYQRTDEQKQLILSRLNQVLNPQWETGFHEAINALYKEVTEEYSSPPDAAQKMLTLLREARQIMIDSPEDFVNAEYRLMQIRAMLDRIKESRRQSRRHAPGLFIYEMFWLLILLAGLVFAAPMVDFIRRIGQVSEPSLINLAPIVNTMLWGGIGGVVGALYALWWHVSDKQDFDRHYQMWYFVQPPMGMVLGAITFLIMTGGLLILDVNLMGDTASPGARLLPYLIAVLAGFKQNFVYDQLERLVSAFTPANKQTATG